MTGQQEYKKIQEKVIDTLSNWNGELIDSQKAFFFIIKNKANSTVTEERRKSLRNLLNSKDTISFLDIHNALSAIVIENTSVKIDSYNLEFDGMWASSLTDSTSKGKPDIEAVDTSSRLNTLNEVMEEQQTNYL